jgi:hypothetical protein
LVLRDDNLARVRVLGARNRVLEQADRSNDLAFLNDAHLATFEFLARAKVARVTNDLLGLDRLVAAANANELSISISDNLMNGLVEHVSPTIDGRETGERLGKFTKAVERVNVRGFAISRHGGGVKDDAIVGWARRLGDVAGGGRGAD